MVACPLVVASLAVVTSANGQSTSGPNTGAVTLTGRYDVVNAFLFRGLPQDDTGVIMQPEASLAFALHSGEGGLKGVRATVGTWNSLHTGIAGTDGLGRLWYWSEFRAGLDVEFAGGVSVGGRYTAYTSPNSGFTSVKEISFHFAFDDSRASGRFASRPYVIVARELEGQADGGASEGTYLELGAAPGIGGSRLRIAVPVRLGLSLGDYYEGASGDERFGFVSVAGLVTVPFSSRPTRFGTWNVHAGVEFVRLGDRNETILGARSKVIGSVGIGLSY
jgi:hypothetical protein